MSNNSHGRGYTGPKPDLPRCIGAANHPRYRVNCGLQHMVRGNRGLRRFVGLVRRRQVDQRGAGAGKSQPDKRLYAVGHATGGNRML